MLTLGPGPDAPPMDMFFTVLTIAVVVAILAFVAWSLVIAPIVIPGRRR